jgi:hypothetical protein
MLVLTSVSVSKMAMSPPAAFFNASGVALIFVNEPGALSMVRMTASTCGCCSEAVRMAAAWSLSACFKAASVVTAITASRSARAVILERSGAAAWIAVSEASRRGVRSFIGELEWWSDGVVEGWIPVIQDSITPPSILREDGRGREALFEVVVEVFLAGHLDLGPACRTDADDSAGADAFDDEVGLETDLDAAAAEGGLARCSGDIHNGPL